MTSGKRRNLGLLITVVFTTAVVSFGVSFFVFRYLNYLRPSYNISFDPGQVNYSSIKKFNDVRNILTKAYYENVDQNVLLEGAVAGMADSLKDPYTVYFTKEQMAKFMERSEGSYVGIGVSVNQDKDGILTIVECFEGSPAKSAGLLQGDKIIEVDGQDVTSIRDEDVVISMIKGQENTKVNITVYRPSEGKSIKFEMTRKRIKIDNIKSEMLQGNIGYIKIAMFDGEIYKYFEEHLDRLISQGMKGLIIDLRDNPGGSYDQVVAIADRLLPEGLIVYTEDKYKNRKEERSDSRKLDMPIVVLTNEYSASASEILAGALKDNNWGTLVGTKTFGKGLVQSIVNLDDGSGLKVTVAKYFTPSGVCIQGVGIQPDYEVKVGEKYENKSVSEIPREEDEQFKKAVEVMKAKLTKQQ